MKNERRNATSLNTNENFCIKDRAKSRVPGAGSCEGNSKENEFPFRTGLIFCFFFIKKKENSIKIVIKRNITINNMADY